MFLFIYFNTCFDPKVRGTSEQVNPGPIVFSFIVAILLHMPHEIKRMLSNGKNLGRPGQFPGYEVGLNEDDMNDVLALFT